LRDSGKHLLVLAVGLTAVVVPSSAPAATWTFTNTTPITIPDPATPINSIDCGPTFCRPATPYPSSIEVGVNGGSITDVDVDVSGLSHALSSEVGILLSGPTTMGGLRSLMLMDGAGSGGADNLALAFDDSASAQLPDVFPDPITSGTWRPTMHEAGVDWPNPGPGTTYANPGPAESGTATLASTFNDKAPNGTWDLWVADFVENDLSGSIASGWSLEITTSAPSEPTLTATAPPSPANENDLRVIGSAPAGTTVRLYDGCPFQQASEEVASGTAEELGSPGISVSVPDDSTNTFFATAEEAGVGGSNCSNAVTYTEDSTPPETELTKVPPNRTSRSRVRFKFEADEEDATFKCKIDQTRFKPCTSPKTVKVDEGRHKFRVRATDPAGNRDPTPAKDTFKVVT